MDEKLLLWLAEVRDEMFHRAYVESVDAGNTVTNGEHGADFFKLGVSLGVSKLLSQYC